MTAGTIRSEYGLDEQVGGIGYAGAFTQSGGLNCFLYRIQPERLQPALSLALRTWRCRDVHHERWLSGNRTSFSWARCGTGTFTQTGGTIGGFGDRHWNQAIVYSWAATLARQTGTNTGNGTYNLSGSGLIVGGTEQVGIRASAFSTRAAEPTPSSAEGTIWPVRHVAS